MDELIVENIFRFTALVGGTLLLAITILVAGNVKKEKQRTLQKMLEHGSLNQEQLQRLITPLPQHEVDLRRGILFTVLGITLGIILFLIGGKGWMLAMIPIAAGIVSLILWWFHASKP